MSEVEFLYMFLNFLLICEPMNYPNDMCSHIAL